jgi:hypothetical protein
MFTVDLFVDRNARHLPKSIDGQHVIAWLLRGLHSYYSILDIVSFSFSFSLLSLELRRLTSPPRPLQYVRVKTLWRYMQANRILLHL